MSKAKEDLPLPLSPVMTVSVFRGMVTSMFCRLLTRAPVTASTPAPSSPTVSATVVSVAAVSDAVCGFTASLFLASVPVLVIVV